MGKLHESILPFVQKDFPVLSENLSISEALSTIRREGIGERIVYFYVTDENRRLVGVVPTRRLLMAGLDRRLAEIMVRKVISIPDTSCLLDACEFFVLHRLLAFPVVNKEGHIVGVVDLTQFTDEVFDMAQGDKANAIFETLGLHLADLRKASLRKAFRIRLPWMLVTVFGGTACAFLVGIFEATLADSLVVVFFLALVLGLGESISTQSLAIAIQALHNTRPTFAWYIRALKREAATAFLLGCSCAAAVAAMVYLWRADAPAAAVIGLSIVLSLVLACCLGLSVPALLHALRLDPKIAAGPVTLALSDMVTLLVYFLLAAMVLSR